MVSQQSAFSVLRDGECQNWILQLTYDKKKIIMLYLYETMTVLIRPKSLREMYMEWERGGEEGGDQIKLVTCFGCLYSWVLCCVNDS